MATSKKTTQIEGKIPPQAKEFEESVLGSIMLHRELFDIIADILKPECFYSEANQNVFKAMTNLAGNRKPIDLITVCEELKKMEVDNISPYEVSKLTSAITSTVNVEYHARVILEKYMQRELIRISGEIIGMAYDNSVDVFELLDFAETNVMGVGTKNIKEEMIRMDSVLVKTLKKIEEWRKLDTHVTGVPTGFPEVDKATRGWQPGDLIILAARPSVGKTALALNLIRNAAMGEKKTTVAVWSLEMKAIYLVLRMLASESEIILQRIQTGRLNDDHMAKLMKDGVEKLSKAKIFFDENSNVSIRSITAKCRRLKKRNNLGLVVIDYLQLMAGTTDKSGNREQEVSKISRDLKNLAQELEVPIIALSQITREAAKSVTWETGPPVSSLRESGAIEQDADTIIMLWGPTEKEEKENKDLEGKRRIKIAKQRNGVVLTIDLDFKNEIQLFKSIEDKLTGPQGESFVKVEQEILPF